MRNFSYFSVNTYPRAPASPLGTLIGKGGGLKAKEAGGAVRLAPLLRAAPAPSRPAGQRPAQRYGAPWRCAAAPDAARAAARRAARGQRRPRSMTTQ